MSTTKQPVAIAGEAACPYPAGRPFDPDNVGPAHTPGWLPEARHQGPVLWMPEFSTWLVTRHEDVKRVVMDHRNFSSSSVNKFKELTGCLTEAFPDGHPGRHSMLKMDPPDHTRIRRLADVAFTRKAAEGYTPMLREIADGLVDEFVDAGEVDVVSGFARRFPLLGILAITGIPLELDEEFAQWGTDYFSLVDGFPDSDDQVALAERGKRVRDWMYEFVERRRAEPSNDLISHLIQARDENDVAELSDDEIVGVINSNLVAGVETVASHIPQMLESLLGDRRQWEALLADRSLIPAAVEETLRYWSPSRGVRRTVKHNIEVGGQLLCAGQEVFAAFVSANHDEAVFGDGGRFDIHREGLRHNLAFGRGTHLCIGAQVARKELQVTLACFADRLPELDIAEGRKSIRGVHLMTLARHDSFRVSWAKPT